MKRIKNARIFNGEHFITPTAIEWEGDTITRLYDCYDGSDAIDAKGAILSPGMIDTHIHGSFGVDVLTPGATKTLVEKLPEVGTTSFLPTNATATFKSIQNFLCEVAALMDDTSGTRVLGAHIEGPFFTVANRGAHATELLQDPTIENYNAMVGENAHVVKRVSLAPEKPGGMELVSHLAAQGVLLSAAHTDATAADIEEALARGLTSATHTFNGFFPVHHREENGIAAVLTDDRMICEFIPDLQHISKYAARLIVKAKGTGKTFICSDALAPAHMPDGEYNLGATPIILKDSVATLKEDGRLAGSTISVLKGVKNLVEIMNVPLEGALQMGTYNPAQLLGENKLGRIAVGMQADMLLITPQIELIETIIRGVRIYQA